MREYLEQQTIAIVGFGREGLSTYRFLRELFPEKLLAICDERATNHLADQVQQMLAKDPCITLLTGADYRETLAQYTLIFKAPGIPPREIAPYIGEALVSSATQLFFDVCPAPIIGVTGTKGKSTTSTLIYEVLRLGNRPVVLCGNIGIPALDMLPVITKDSLVVMELSSHQLQLLTKSPHIAVLQNVTPEHLDYYSSFQEYVLAKERITTYQSVKDFLLYNANYPIPYEIAQRSHAKRIPFNADIGQTCCFLKQDYVVYKHNQKQEKIMRRNQIRLLGAYNIQNVMPAIILGKHFNVPTTHITKAITSFKGLEDRLEFVGVVHGADYYNDSLSTTPEAAVGAIEAFGDRVTTILLGGYDRGLDFGQLGQSIANSAITTVILLPTTGERIWAAILAVQQSASEARPIQHFFVSSMEEAVTLAKTHTPPGKVCLLSPASPSFGMFTDYHDRGQQFKEQIVDHSSQ